MGEALDADATIQLDGKAIAPNKAKGPLRLSVGMHLLTIKGDHLDPIEEAFRIVRGENAPLKLETRFYGEVALSFKPAARGAELQVDEKPVAAFQPGKPLRLPVGKHRLRVGGFQPYEQDIILKRGVNPARAHARSIDPIAAKAKKFKNGWRWSWSIEAGTVNLGSPEEEKGHRENEEPRTER